MCQDGVHGGYVQAAEAAVMRLATDATHIAVERVVEEGLARECRAYNQRRPLITVIVHELNSTAGAAAYESAVKSANAQIEKSTSSPRQTRSRAFPGAGRGRGRSSAGVSLSIPEYSYGNTGSMYAQSFEVLLKT